MIDKVAWIKGRADFLREAIKEKWGTDELLIDIEKRRSAEEEDAPRRSSAQSNSKHLDKLNKTKQLVDYRLPMCLDVRTGTQDSPSGQHQFL